MQCPVAKGSGCASTHCGYALIIVNMVASASQRLHAPSVIFISPDAKIDLPSKPVAAVGRFRQKKSRWIGKQSVALGNFWRSS
jgi:hypothetical protein